MKFVAVSRILLTLSGCGDEQILQSPPVNDTQSQSSDQKPQELYRISIEKHVDGKVSIEYPQVEGLDKDLDALLNKRFKEDALAYQKQEEGMLPLDPQQDVYDAKCEIKTQNADMISICKRLYYSRHDAAHPQSFFETYNINPKTGKDIKLKDICNVSEYANNIYKGEKFSVRSRMEVDNHDDYEMEVKKLLSDKTWYSAASAQQIEDDLNEYDLFYCENEKIIVILSVPHALGDYAELVID